MNHSLESGHYADGRLYGWHKPHEVIDPVCQVGVMLVDGSGITVWEAFRRLPWDLLIPVEISITGRSYVIILANHLHSVIRIFFTHQDVIFQWGTMPQLTGCDWWPTDSRHICESLSTTFDWLLKLLTSTSLRIRGMNWRVLFKPTCTGGCSVTGSWIHGPQYCLHWSAVHEVWLLLYMQKVVTHVIWRMNVIICHFNLYCTFYPMSQTEAE